MTPEALEHLRSADKVLARLIKQVGPCGLKTRKRRSPFEALVSAVTHQQLNGIAATTILNRMLALYPNKRFPTPEDLVATTDEKLRGAGLSRAKVAAIKDIATKTLEGIVPDSATIRKLSNEEILARLTTVRGVGPWTVEMLLIFTLGRLDVLPVDDFGIQSGFKAAYQLRRKPTQADFQRVTDCWQPFRSVGSWYLWRHADGLKKR